MSVFPPSPTSLPNNLIKITEHTLWIMSAECIYCEREKKSVKWKTYLEPPPVTLYDIYEVYFHESVRTANNNSAIRNQSK